MAVHTEGEIRRQRLENGSHDKFDLHVSCVKRQCVHCFLDGSIGTIEDLCCRGRGRLLECTDS